MRETKTERSAVGRWSLPIILLLAGVIGGVGFCLSQDADAHRYNTRMAKDDGCHQGKTSEYRHYHVEIGDGVIIDVPCGMELVEQRRIPGR